MDYSNFNVLKYFKHIRNPFLLFLPLLVLYVGVVLKLYTETLEGDEQNYLTLAQNLLNGFYSPPPPNINLWRGPGYPILLTPFVAFNFPLICITLMNAVFQYLSVVMLFKAMMEFITFKQAFLFSLFWGCCYSSFPFIASILTETFTIFMIALLIFALVKTFKCEINKYKYLSGFLLGYIALTKIIFGYVILFLLLWYVVSWLKNSKIIDFRKSILILLLAFTTVSPYLIYTYSLTGRFFYWGNSGGMSLYWMSTPIDQEYGNWNTEAFDVHEAASGFTKKTEFLKKNHQKDITYVSKFVGVEKDDAYKEIALNNIKNHPKKYLKNIYANISRLLFGFPFHYTLETPLLKVWYSALLLPFMLISFILTIINWRKMPFPIQFLSVFVIIYLGGSTLLSAYYRQFLIVIPALIFWISYVLSKSVNLKTRLDKID